ncbi:MAG: Lpg1974 family pore-forming outer membrane protein [Hyphomicrobiaceae bacterium]
MAPANAQSVPGTYFSIEGGGACGFGDELGVPSGDVTAFSQSVNTPFGLYAITQGLTNISSALELGNGGCGWTGRVGLESKGGGLFRLGDSWGLFVRHSDINSDNETASATSAFFNEFTLNGTNLFRAVAPIQLSGVFAGEYEEKRTVVDFEVGQDIGIGGGSKTRVFGGVRYAHFKAETNLNTTSGNGFGTPTYANIIPVGIDSESKFQGAGPRIGVQTTFPISSRIGLSLGASGSILWGRQKVETTVNGAFLNLPTTRTNFKDSDTTWVGNVEGEAALNFEPFGRGMGQLDIGVRAEGWFRQSEDYAEAVGGGDKQDRHNWGPFGRFTMKIN